MTDRSITADAGTVSGADFARSLGLRIRTKAERLAEWQAEVRWYVDHILSGCEFSSFGNPAVAEAMRIIALHEGDAEVTGDPLLNKRRCA